MIKSTWTHTHGKDWKQLMKSNYCWHQTRKMQKSLQVILFNINNWNNFVLFRYGTWFNLCHPNYRRVYKSLEADFYKEVTDEDQAETFVRDFKTKNEAKCYSGIMTIAESIKFWSHPNSIQNFDKSSSELRCSIITWMERKISLIR